MRLTGDTRSRGARLVNGLGLAVALSGLGLQFVLTVGDVIGQGRGVLAAVGLYLSFFTILTNLLAGLTHLAALGLAGRRLAVLARPRVATGVLAAMILLAIVYHALLAGLADFEGLWRLADVLLHTVAPAVFVLWWLVQPDHGRLRAIDPVLWSAWPIAYLGFALARAPMTGTVPYPFLDFWTRGWPAVMQTCIVIAAAFVAGGYLIFVLDGRLGRHA